MSQKRNFTFKTSDNNHQEVYEVKVDDRPYGAFVRNLGALPDEVSSLRPKPYTYSTMTVSVLDGDQIHLGDEYVL